MRSATQLLRSIGTSKVTSRIVPSAVIQRVAATRPLTTISTGTSRVPPGPGVRARSRSQYGVLSSGSCRSASSGCSGSRAATCAVTFTVPGRARRTSLSRVPTSTPSTRKSIRWLLPSVT